MTEKEQTQKIVETHINQLIEHFDSVRIFVTKRTEDGSSQSFTLGRGCYYAQVGLIEEWRRRIDQDVRNEQNLEK